MRKLELLGGSWRGKGHGDYPTIDAFDYEEHLRFEPDSSYPMIHYEQRTKLLPSNEASHWESGFIRPQEDGTVEISSSQDSGRVEVLSGRLVDDPGDGIDLKLELNSLVLDHDPRLVQTRRTFILRGDTLRYIVYMATNTTPEPKLGQHLEAVLHRVADPR